MNEIHLQIAKELTLAVIDKAGLVDLDRNKDIHKAATNIGEVFQVILKKVSEQN